MNKTIDQLSIVLSVKLTTLKGLVLAAMPRLTSGLKPPLTKPLRGSFGQPVRDTWLGRAEKYRSGCSGLKIF